MTNRQNRKSVTHGRVGVHFVFLRQNRSLCREVSERAGEESGALQHRRSFFLSPSRELKALNSARKILSAAAPFISASVRPSVCRRGREVSPSK